MYSENDWRAYELYHHGVLGMHWGVQNGPPYPLDRSISTGKRLKGSNKLTKEERQQKRIEKAEADYKKKNSEDYSNKAEIYKTAALIALDIIMLNPAGLVYDAGRLGAAAYSGVQQNKYSKERIGEKTDKVTGYKLKSSTMTIKEDAKRVNPSVYNFDANTKSNCMLCSTAYDMRRRGYDVQAKTAGAGFQMESIKDWYPKSKLQDVTRPNHAKNMFTTKEKTASIETLISELGKQGEGARGNLGIWYSNGVLNSVPIGGHSVAYEISNGSVKIIDAQIGKVYNTDRAIKNMLMETTGDFQYARTDNVDFDIEKIKRCCA